MTVSIPAFSLLLLVCTLPAQEPTHGSMAGSLRPKAAVIWTRASAPALVSVRYDSRADFATAQESPAVAVDATTDFTCQIELTGLSPATRYYYATKLTDPKDAKRFVFDRVSEFTTPPRSDVADPVAFLISADVFHKSEYGVFDRMRQHDAAFYISIGDMPYADLSRDLAEYRSRHKVMRDDPRWLAFIAQFPIEAVWDDHEVGNDWDADSDPKMVAFGKQAFREFFPIPKQQADIYRTIRWGQGVEIFLLDTRSYRDANAAPSVPGKTMLGKAQLEWLKSSLLASTARFKVICSTIPLRFGHGNMDDWDGFIAERRQILQYVLAKDIRNVLLLTGDNHLAAAHHHREGLREYITGPLAQDVKEQVGAPPEVRFRASVHNYAQVSFDPIANPATLTIAFFDAQGQPLYSEVLRDEAPATVRVQSDAPEGAFSVEGPAFLSSRGNDVLLPRVEPGQCTVRFGEQAVLDHAPAPIRFPVPPGAHVDVAGAWHEQARPRILMAELFERPIEGGKIIDEPGTRNGPSAWVVDRGVLYQASRIDSPVGATDADRPGTILELGDVRWTDYTTTVQIQSRERGRIGVLFRYQDPDNFYRLVIDAERPLRRLEKKVKGVYTTLDSRAVPYFSHNPVDVTCAAVGERIEVMIDGERVFSVKDDALASGKVGLYVWQNRITEFEHVIVTTGDGILEPTGASFVDLFRDGKLAGWKFHDVATASGPSRWVENSGVMMQIGKIGDPIPQSPADPGTLAIAEQVVPDDMRFSTRLISFDQHAMGVVFRYTDPDNHYRFAWDRERRFRRLCKVVGGAWSVLWEDHRDFNVGQWYQFNVETVGDRIRIFADDDQLAEITDGSHPKGAVGLYVFGSSGVLFDRVIVQTPRIPLPSLAAVLDGGTTTIHGLAPRSSGKAYGLALSMRREPGIPLAILAPLDPRVLPLAPDSLFIASFAPTTIWSNFRGRVAADGGWTASIRWPSLANLKGTTLYLGGWTGDIGKEPVQEMLPTVELKL